MNWQKVVGYFLIFLSFAVILFFGKSESFWDEWTFWIALGFGIAGAALSAWGEIKNDE